MLLLQAIILVVLILGVIIWADRRQRHVADERKAVGEADLSENLTPSNHDQD